MFTVVITEKGGAQRRLQFDKSEITIGRVQGNDIILPKGNVSKRHSRIVLKDQRFIVVDLKSTNGTYVNGRKITSPLVVKGGDKIYIGDFIMTLEDAEGGDTAGAGAEQQPASAPIEAPPPPRAVTPAPPPPQPAPSAQRAITGSRPAIAAPNPGTAPVQLPVDRAVPPRPLRPTGEVLGPPPSPPSPAAKPPIRDDSAAHAPPPAQPDRFAIDEDPADESAPPAPRVVSQPQAPAAPARVAPAAPRPAPAPSPVAPPLTAPVPVPALRAAPDHEMDTGFRGLMKRLGASFDTRSSDASALHDATRWQQAQSAIDSVISTMTRDGQLATSLDRGELAGAALREAVGLGAIEALFSNASVREIVVESAERIVADLGSGLQPVAGVYSSPDAVLTMARRLVAQAGQALDPERPIHEARLPDGTHVMVLQRPVAVRGPVVCIRRSSRQPITAMELVHSGVLSGEMLDLLRMAVNARRNVLVSGTVGSGVTTLLGALAGLVNEQERLVTIENVADLAIGRPVVALTAGGGRALATGDLLKQAAWLRPDRLVVDDVQGPEAYDVLVTMSSRRDGTLAGVHASSAADALRHVELIAKLNPRAGSVALAPLIAEAVHIVVQVQLLADGSRRVTGISEVLGADGDQLVAQDLFTFDGEFHSTGVAPRFLGG